LALADQEIIDGIDSSITVRELVPTVTRIAVLLNPTYTAPEAQLKKVEEAARTRDYRLRFFMPAPS
jgi:hypothetical protein